MIGACNECDRLSREYGDAMRKVVWIEGALQIARVQPNPAPIANTEARLGEAVRLQAAARRALMEHKATHESRRTDLAH